jgi:endoglucanase
MKIMALNRANALGEALSGFAAILIACVFVQYAVAAEGEIAINGTTILRDGRPWIAKGVTMVGRVAPAAVTRAGTAFERARNQFDAQELAAAKRFGADLIRFQVSQGGSDPQSRIFSDDYLKEVTSAVKMARDLGFSVIVSLQAESPSGLDESGMPNIKAHRAWQRLTPEFAADRGVMLELFNEPSPNGPDTVLPHNWDSWKAAMQPLVDEVRKLGAKNVLLVDGLYWAQMLDGAPQLDDPMSQIMYAVHPYYSQRLRNERDWDNMFGDFARRHPVLVTEWNAVSFRGNCNSNTPSFAADMLTYLNQRKIGLVAWAFDFPGSVIKNSDGTLTSFDGFHCGPSTNFAAGELIHHQFTN